MLANRAPTRFFLDKLLSEHSLKITSWLFCAVIVLVSGGAFGESLAPLEQFLSAGRASALEARESEATLQQRAAETQQARFRLLPTLSVSAGYTFNQFEAAASFPTGGTTQRIVITPQNQLDAQVSVAVPIVDASAWARIGAAEENERAARLRRQDVATSTDRRVAQLWFQLVASDATIASAQRALGVAEETLARVERRVSAGVATALELDRAKSEVERAMQTIDDARLQRRLSARALETITGLSANGTAPSLSPSTPTPPALETLLAGVSTLPSVRAAVAERTAAEANARAAWMTLVPTVQATATERFTNAAGFANQYAIFSAGVALSWRGDLSNVHNANAQAAAVSAARVREERALQTARDEILDAHARLANAVVRARVAATQERVSAQNAASVRARFAQGTATHLDVVTADRDAFASEVARITSDAELAFANVSLFLAAGLGLNDRIGAAQ